MSDKKRCEFYIILTRHSYFQDRVRHNNGYCKRTATYTNGEKYYCKQHAKNPATVLKKADGKIMDGFYPIHKT